MKSIRITGALVGSFGFAYVCDDLIFGRGKIFGGTTPSTVLKKELMQETDKKS